MWTSLNEQVLIVLGLMLARISDKRTLEESPLS